MVHADGDRRTRVRYEVFGAFWGTFDAGEAVRVRNLTQHGALLEAQEPMAIESIQSLCLVLDGEPALTEARVRHHEPADPMRPDCHLVGVEFVGASPAFIDTVERLMTFRAPPTELA